jgi:N-acetylglutamate synthase-like GNAT family acetyltransferase
MLSYRIAVSSDAEALLQTRRSTVVNNMAGKYPRVVLEAWAPIIDSETIAKETEAIKKSERISLIAESDGKMVGLCTINTAEGLLQQCYVLPEYTGRGIAAELVKRIEIIAQEKGLSSLRLSSSLIALNFYKKQGYHELNSYDYDLGNGLQMQCVMMEKELEKR